MDAPVRHALTELPDGGVLVDLFDGSIHRLNKSALEMCRRLLEGQKREDIARALADRFHLSRSAVEADLDRVLAELFRPLRDAPPQRSSPFELDTAAEGFVASLLGRPIFEVGTDELRLVDRAFALDPRFRQSIRWLLPHLLVHRGHAVLHASAVEEAGSTIAYSGPSGAGKTTIAAWHEGRGARVAAGDLTILGEDGGAFFVHLEGEARLFAWADLEASALERAPERPAELGALEDVFSGPRARLARIAFLDAARRRSDLHAVALEAMGPSEGLASLLINAFGELGRSVWPELVRFSGRLARDVPSYSATVPSIS